MLFKPEYDENGKKILCEMNGINSEMLMDIYVKKMKKGEVLEICEDKNECAILLLSGDVTFKVEDETNAAREKILLKKSLTQFIFANRLRRVLPQTRTAKCSFK